MKYLRLSTILAALFLMSAGALFGNTINVTTTIQAAINSSSPNDTVAIPAGTFNEAVVVNKQITLLGVGPTTIITPPSGNGITVTANNVNITSLKVTGATDNGIYAHNVSNLRISSVTADHNGNSAVGSGIYVDGITGTSSLNSITATNNQVHGISIGDGSNGVTVNGGTFTGNGVSANAQTGGGINVHSVSGAISSISVIGTVNSSSNYNAGIILFAEPSGSISGVSIGSSGTITLSTNGSGSIGEGVAIAGNVSTVSITAQFTEGSLTNGAGVAVVGTDNAGANSPSGVTINGSTFSGYGLSTPAITLASSSSSPQYISTNPVTATGNTIGADGFQTEDLVYHKLDNASLGLVTTNATNLYVTTNSGSIQRGINAATTQTVNVGTGTYTESVTLSKAITLAGVDTSAKINGSLSITSDNATVSNLVVYGSAGDGITSSGKSGLTLTGVVSRDNSGSGAVLTNCSTVAITNGSYSWNTVQGINATGGSSYTLSGVTASGNGNATPQGSGINLKNISGTSSATNCTANNNHFHGISVGDGASGVTISGGTFTGNGTSGDARTGAGINIVAQNTTTTSNVTVSGTISSSNNTTAGIYIFADSATVNAINTVSIGATGSLTLSNNGSNGVSYNGGAGVVLYGKITGVSIGNTAFSKGSAPGGGLLNLGDGTVGGSPSGTTVSNSSFSGYTSATPAVSLTDGHGHTSPNDVTATNNTFTFPVAIKVFLQGPYSGGSMSTALLTGGYIPITQPYNTAAFGNYNGGESVGSVPANVVDWVLIELRLTSNGAAVSRAAAFLKSDGTVVDLTGSSARLFTETVSSGYTISNFIIVRHRNHLAVMSATATTLPNDASAYDFTVSANQAFGASSMAALSGGAFGMYAGDATEDGFVTTDDFSPWLVANTAGASGYAVTDFNLNGFVTTDDFALWLVNNGLGASSLVP
ncbi:MAG TPA: right-handed parallel beta-helix repeat-containing protein [Bacteroidota bacterium]|nr:right-handed parallel beta-helix repeat-containing protein [Bacteroidota bacterium]